MKTNLALAAAFAFCCGGGASIAPAQKGVGETTGVAQQVVKSKVTSVSGTIRRIETGPCKATTGRADIGTHLVIETAKGEKLNIHLGPTAVVRYITNRLKTGDTVTVNAFRTEKMTEDHFVAQSIVLGKASAQLRDENLRPYWAGGGNAIRGRGGPQSGAGYGRGRGGGGGRGSYQTWSDMPPNRGPGWGAQGRGRGGGYGQGRGRGYGQGYGQGQGRWRTEAPATSKQDAQDGVD